VKTILFLLLLALPVQASTGISTHHTTTFRRPVADVRVQWRMREYNSRPSYTWWVEKDGVVVAHGAEDNIQATIRNLWEAAGRYL
jgi:hypothetical protein